MSLLLWFLFSTNNALLVFVWAMLTTMILTQLVSGFETDAPWITFSPNVILSSKISYALGGVSWERGSSQRSHATLDRYCSTLTWIRPEWRQENNPRAVDSVNPSVDLFYPTKYIQADAHTPNSANYILSCQETVFSSQYGRLCGIR